MRKFFVSTALLLCASSVDAAVITSGQWNKMIAPTEDGVVFFANKSFDKHPNNPTTYDQGWEYLSAKGDANTPVAFTIPGALNPVWTMGETAWTDGVGTYNAATGVVSYDAHVPGHVSNSVDGYIQYAVMRLVTMTKTYYRIRVEDIVAAVIGLPNAECSARHAFCGDFTDNELTLDEASPIIVEIPEMPTIPEPSIFALVALAGLGRRYAWKH